MNAKELIRDLMKTLKFKQQDMIDGLKAYGQNVSQPSLADRLNTKKSNNMTVGNLNAMLHVLGYKVVVQPVGIPTPASGFELDDGVTAKTEGESK